MTTNSPAHIHAPELLMPAGSPDKARFAFAYGADAVYAGVPIFSLRARENEFNAAIVRESIDLARNHGKKIYLTMNIYAHNSKVDRFLDAFCEMADLHPDGFIMADTGLIVKALKLRPNAVIHLSTQANATNWTTVEFWRDIGVRRVILPRELSLKEIELIHQNVPDIELECFVHGAICIAYSGRCLISNYLNHRDANQGTCTNSCRWQYALAHEKGSIQETEPQSVDESYTPLEGTYSVKVREASGKGFLPEAHEIDEDENGTYLMNAKDLCAIEVLGEIAAAGICSFKVEGRTKSEYYTATVARAYRRAIDDLIAGRPFDRSNLDEVMATASRTFTTGFFLKRANEYAINYEDGESRPLTHRYVGRVLEYSEKTGLATIEAKNKFCIGEVVEWITPEGTYSAKVDMIEDAKGCAVSAAHGGLHFSVPAPFPVNDLTLLRTQVSSSSAAENATPQFRDCEVANS